MMSKIQVLRGTFQRPRRAQQTLALANQARDAKDYEKAALLYEKYLAENPHDAAIHIQCAHMQKECGRLNDAGKHYLTAYDLTPHDADLQVQLGHYYKVCGNLEDAIAAYRHATELDPNNTDAQNELAATDFQRSYNLLDNSDLFDRNYYLARYPDIRIACLNPIEHYLIYGATERRDPSPAFNTAYYLHDHDDVAATGTNPLVHYLMTGRKEGRAVQPALEIEHAQVELINISDDQNNGVSEHPELTLPQATEDTPPELISKSGLFDAKWYATTYSNVLAQGIDPFDHFIAHGLREGLNPCRYFDVNWYCTMYPDVPASGSSAVLHYIQWGSREGRWPSEHFDSNWYLKQNPEIATSGENPLAHYLRVGEAEARAPKDFNVHYRREIVRETQQTLFELDEIRRHISLMWLRPRFLIYVDNQDGDLSSTVTSIERQIYGDYTLVKSLRLNDIASTEARYIIWVRSGDTLNPRALYEFACAINSDPTLDMIYSDEDSAKDGIRSRPFYKPDWSPDYLESFNYIGYAACYRLEVALNLIVDVNSAYDLAIRVTEKTTKISHIRKILYHRAESKSAARDFPDNEIALRGRLSRTGRIGKIIQVRPKLPCYHILTELTDTPLVSIIIPTAGKIVDIAGRRISLLENLLDAIQYRTTYSNIEIIIVDNGNLDAARVRNLRQRNCQMITYTDPIFNISKKLNLGVTLAAGKVLLLVNDDIEPLTPDWIERLLGHLEKPHTGVIGAKLLFPDMTIQHAGVAHNAGHPDHVRRRQPRDELGYFYSTCGSRNYSAVTGACMMTRTDLYRAVGGYNEELAISYNDVDYCFKVRQKGFTIVYTASVEIIHFESQSRVAQLEQGEGEYFADFWGSMLTTDPFYNEDNLAVEPPTFDVKHNLRRI